MFRALYTAASGMQAQQTNLDTIANNLSNSSTAGCADLLDLLGQCGLRQFDLVRRVCGDRQWNLTVASEAFPILSPVGWIAHRAAGD